MSMWDETNKRLRSQNIRSNALPKRLTDNRRDGMKQGTDRVITRESTDADGKTVRRRAIVPKSRSKYSPKPGDSIGPAKPGRTCGKWHE